MALGMRRREALQLLAANMALAAAGCTKPVEEIVPYVTMPERLVPGVPAEVCNRAASRRIRPRRHRDLARRPPHKDRGQSRGTRQASVPPTFSPKRKSSISTIRRVLKCLFRGTISAPWKTFFAAWQAVADAHRQDKGAGLALLTGRITSPTLAPADRYAAGDVSRDGVARLRAFGWRRGASGETCLRPAARHAAPD